jgi:hypothetical protein
MISRQPIITPFRMTAKIAEKMIRDLSQDSANIIWSGHSVERSEERDITYLDALEILRKGMVMSDPLKGKHEGEWKCKVIKKLRESRDAGVVTILMTKQNKLKVVTVEWEDLT